MPLFGSFINRFGLAEPAVAASIHYYESHPSLSREGYKTDISHLFVLAEPAVAASIHYYESNPSLSREEDNTTFARISSVINLDAWPMSLTLFSAVRSK